MMGET